MVAYLKFGLFLNNFLPQTKSLTRTPNPKPQTQNLNLPTLPRRSRTSAVCLFARPEQLEERLQHPEGLWTLNILNLEP